MAGVIAKRLRLTTSRKPSYRRAGVKIGTVSAPTYVLGHEITVGQLLAVLLDPNIALAVETEDGRFETVSAEERETKIKGLKQVIEMDGPDRTVWPDPDADETGRQPNTAEPQGGGSDPDAEASKASGPEATANASAGSAADAGTTEPTAQSDPPAPELAPPASKGGAKPKPVKAKP